MTWREATREEIRLFYQEEFPEYIDALPSFLTPAGPKEWAIAFREEYPVVGDKPDKPFIRRSSRRGSGSPPSDFVFKSWDDVLPFIQSPAHEDPLKETESDDRLADPAVVDTQSPVPEAVYFAVDTHNYQWPVVVDIDADDVAEKNARAILEEKGREDELGRTEKAVEKVGFQTQPPEGHDYRYEDVQDAISYAFEVERYFQKRLNGEETLVIYTGQGAHVYLLDPDTDHHYDESSRQVIVDLLKNNQNIPIDPVVTTDQRRVMRLPYSLHAGVSRVVQPITTEEFDPRTDALPEIISGSEAGQTTTE